MKNDKNHLILLSILLIIASAIFFKNAWVTEDAYINFRSVEQVFAGNGPIWNPHERVQVFTSPLWFWTIVLVRYFSNNLFLNVIFLSYALFLLTLFVFYQFIKDIKVFSIGMLFLIISNSFFDFTSSGLENILGYFLITLMLMIYLQIFQEIDGIQISNSHNNEKFLTIASLIVFGLIICVRHDLLLLMLPPAIFIIWNQKKLFSLKKWLMIIAISLLPFTIWSVFSTFYYGFPFPNTAYAKLGTQISRPELFNQGLLYYYSTIQQDLITLLLILVLFVYSIINRNKTLLVINIGILFNFLYILSIGGDFMRGRFFSYAFLVTAFLLAIQVGKLKSKFLKTAIPVILIIYGVFYPHTPVNSPIDYFNDRRDYGIADERGYFFRYLSFNKYVLSRFRNESFPQHFLCEEGKNAPPLSISQNVGLYGYCASLDKIIIDPLALTDPFLARIPVSDNWQIGHFYREIPDGYIQSVALNQPLIKDPELNELYKEIVLITRNENLLSLERLRSIFRMNIRHSGGQGDRK